MTSNQTSKGKAPLKVEAVHSPQVEEYGATPDPTLSPTRKQAPVLCHPSQSDGLPVWGTLPTDLWAVCPNMPAVTRCTPPEGPAFYVLAASKADLAAWKATRTKRLPNRATQGSYQLDARTATTPPDAQGSDRARRAWDTRRAAQAQAQAQAPTT